MAQSLELPSGTLVLKPDTVRTALIALDPLITSVPGFRLLAIAVECAGCVLVQLKRESSGGGTRGQSQASFTYLHSSQSIAQGPVSSMRQKTLPS